MLWWPQQYLKQQRNFLRIQMCAGVLVWTWIWGEVAAGQRCFPQARSRPKVTVSCA